jgi:hypothetical protein
MSGKLGLAAHPSRRAIALLRMRSGKSGPAS